MHKFELWAPEARKVEVQAGSRRWPLEKEERGWWSAEVEAAGPGSEYTFLVDGGEPTPDPRSAFQPRGIHGPSQIVDHSAYRWNDTHWQAPPLPSGVLYEMHVGTFTPQGTFLSAIERLDHLVELGVTHLELMPVNEFSGSSGWGYDGVDLYAPHHAYGTPDDLKTLVDACHARGLAVLLDVVYNHLGPAGNYLSRFGPYFTKAYETPWGEAVNLDHEGSVEVRRYLIDNACMWLRDYHFDGLRLDAIHAFYDRSAVHFLEELSAEVDKLSAHLGRHYVLIAESDLNDPKIVTPREAGGYGIDAQWSDDFHHALHSVLTGETNGYYEDFGTLAQLAKALRNAYVYDGVYSQHRKRVHGRPVIHLSGHHFLAYAQNHDQIGNRARGERLCQLVSEGRCRIAAALVFTSAFIPMLFQGEEFGASSPFQYFTHHDDAELAHNVSEGRKNEFRAFGWKPDEVPDPQSSETFERSNVRWDEVARQPHAGLLEWHRKLIALRRKHAVLTDGRMENVEVRFDEDARWLAVRRGSIEVVCNLAGETRAIEVGATAELELGSENGVRVDGDKLKLPPDSVGIVVHRSAQAGRVPAGAWRSASLSAERI
ncbi:MAG TPA: malto-oligosyltrehalose trehalohydrolase [Bryobacteraceae bacterium]|jgi:maltooligosyltrehalose trehalohydrolase|nr:malto-oligosyltrehalose trehalohydrolase [Bryobacteraceae bacterium]